MASLIELKPSVQVIRKQRVMLSGELARLYGVSPSVLMQAVKRNLSRFPDDFMFQLTISEWQSLKSQIVTSSLKSDLESLKSQIVISNKVDTKRGGARTPPYAFTEQGVAMLSSVLNSERAINVNIEIMRTFVKLRQLVTEHKDLTHRLDALEDRYDDQFKVVFDAIRSLMESPKPKSHPIGFTTDINSKQAEKRK